jgi:hypothetical protein
VNNPGLNLREKYEYVLPYCLLNEIVHLENNPIALMLMKHTVIFD